MTATTMMNVAISPQRMWRNIALIVLAVWSLSSLHIQEEATLTSHPDHETTLKTNATSKALPTPCADSDSASASFSSSSSSSTTSPPPTTPSWPAICHKLQPHVDMNTFWASLRPVVEHATLHESIRHHATLQAWMHDWWDHVQDQNWLAQSAVLPYYTPATMDALLQILSRRWMEILRRTENHTTNDTTTTTTTTSSSSSTTVPPPPPLHVMVFGGSPTAGHECPKNPFGIVWGGGGPVLRPSLPCAWPGRLEEMINAVLWSSPSPHRPSRNTNSSLVDDDNNNNNKQPEDDSSSLPPLVQVVNMAIAGSSSQVGATILQYQLWPRNENNNNNNNNKNNNNNNNKNNPNTIVTSNQDPDLILWNHAINDANEPGGTTRQVQILNEFQRAVQSLRPCNDDLPAVIYVDDWHGKLMSQPHASVESIQTHAQVLYQHASWYRVPIVAPAQAVRHEFLQLWRHDGPKTKQQQQHAYITFGKFDVHPGMMHHVFVAWSVTYQLLHALRGRCQQMAGQQLYQHNKKNNDATTTTTTDTVPKPWKTAANQSALPIKDVPDKLVYSPQTTRAVHLAWEQQTKVRRDICHHSSSSSSSSFSYTPTAQPCVYAWMTSKATRVASQDKVRQLLQPYLLYNTGWQAAGFASRSPKLGWDATHEHATFAMRIPISVASGGDGDGGGGGMMVNRFVLAVMQSYGPKWEGTQLQVSVTNLNRTTTSTSTSTGDSTTTTTAHDGAAARQTFTAEGFHESQTSTTFLYKYELDPAHPGEILDLVFNLTQGDNFKIMGMALCAQWM